MALSDFDIKERLGAGTYGEVFRVIRKADRRVYVMKKVRISGLSKREQQEAINEVKILASLDSPYICKYYDSFIEGAHLYLVMEFAEKGNLHERIRRQRGKRFEEALIWSLFIQIGLAIKHLHDKNILHRDIKSPNIFLDRGDKVKLGDMGLAKVLSSSSQMAHTLVGTPYYLSPELCENKPYNEKSDVWALGCTLYELCTLRHPFDANNQGALILKIVRGRYPPVTGYSTELRHVLDACLTRDTKVRPNLASILSRPFVVAKAQELGIPMPPDVLERCQERRERIALRKKAPVPPAAAAARPKPARKPAPAAAAPAAAPAPAPAAARKAAPARKPAPAAAGGGTRVRRPAGQSNIKAAALPAKRTPQQVAQQQQQMQQQVAQQQAALEKQQQLQQQQQQQQQQRAAAAAAVAAPQARIKAVVGTTRTSSRAGSSGSRPKLGVKDIARAEREAVAALPDDVVPARPASRASSAGKARATEPTFSKAEINVILKGGKVDPEAAPAPKPSAPSAAPKAAATPTAAAVRAKPAASAQAPAPAVKRAPAPPPARTPAPAKQAAPTKATPAAATAPTKAAPPAATPAPAMAKPTPAPTPATTAAKQPRRQTTEIVIPPPRAKVAPPEPAVTWRVVDRPAPASAVPDDDGEEEEEEEYEDEEEYDAEEDAEYDQDEYDDEEDDYYDDDEYDDEDDQVDDDDDEGDAASTATTVSLGQHVDRRNHLVRAIDATRAWCAEQLGRSAFEDIYAFFKERADDDGPDDDDEDAEDMIASFVYGRMPQEKSDVLAKVYQLLYLETELRVCEQRIASLRSAASR